MIIAFIYFFFFLTFESSPFVALASWLFAKYPIFFCYVSLAHTKKNRKTFNICKNTYYNSGSLQDKTLFVLSGFICKKTCTFVKKTKTHIYKVFFLNVLLFKSERVESFLFKFTYQKKKIFAFLIIGRSAALFFLTMKLKV
jgi:hypothetical protein